MPADTLDDPTLLKNKVYGYAAYLDSGHTEYIEYSTGFPVLGAQAIPSTDLILSISNRENVGPY